MSYNPYQQTPAAPVSRQSSTQWAMARVKTPAILLIISGVVGILSGIFGGGGTAALYLGLQEEMIEAMEDEQDQDLTVEELKMTMTVMGWSGVAAAVLGSIAGVISIAGGIYMLKLRGWSIAMLAAILSLIPCIQVCCLFSTPVGIYVIVVLCDSQIKPAFK